MQRGNLSRQNSFDDRTSPSSNTDLDAEDEEEIQARAALMRNDSPSAALPMDQGDLERGVQRREGSTSDSWREWAVGLLSPAPQSRRGEEADRDR
jgi:hypothetical protein